MEHLLLDLTKGAFGVKEARELVDMLEMNTVITTLKVLALGDREARLLSEALKSCRHITAVRRSLFFATWAHTFSCSLFALTDTFYCSMSPLLRFREHVCVLCGRRLRPILFLL